MQNTSNEYLKREITNYLYDIAKEYNTDVIGFKGICQTEYLTEDEFDKIRWNDIFQDSFFSVDVKTQISTSNLFNKE